MSIEVIMPQMGESITEGTLTKWLKKEGDAVARDEDFFEISTDKVDTVVPAPAAGVVQAIKVKEGETVPVGTVVALIAAAGEAKPAPQAAVKAAVAVPAPAAPAAAAAAPGAKLEARPAERVRSSPLVRKIAREHGIDVAGIPGSGLGGRVTRDDILQVVAKAPAAAAARVAPTAAPHGVAGGASTRLEPLTKMRKKIAEHMVHSKHTSAHVHTVFEIDFKRVAELREMHKKSFAERHGIKLTYTAFIAKATVDALASFPLLNASMDGDNVVYHQSVNLGIAVALDWGLIVPVVKSADGLNLVGIARAINDLGERARTKKLDPADVQDGTFTITNPGIYGGQFGTPIINQPQLAILGVGVVEKRAVVVDDAIAIRPRSYFALGFDHRLIDGAVADQFMALLKTKLETFEL